MEKDLVLGMGYKTCWMVINEVNQKEIVELLLEGDVQEVEYRAGLLKVSKSRYEERIVMVTADYEHQNYVIGDAVSKIFYNRDKILKRLETFPKVYAYMTDRVSECHGFALLEYGKIIRLYCFDEEEIQNIGEPLLEEIKLGFHLPTNFKEMWEHWEDDSITKVGEEVIVELAKKQVGINVEKYPYAHVITGVLKLLQ